MKSSTESGFLPACRTLSPRLVSSRVPGPEPLSLADSVERPPQAGGRGRDDPTAWLRPLGGVFGRKPRPETVSPVLALAHGSDMG